eukprot:77963_1
MSWAPSSTSSAYASGSGAAILSKAAIELTPFFIQAAFGSAGITIPTSAAKLACQLVSEGAKHCLKFVSYSYDYPLLSDKYLPTPKEFSAATIVELQLLSRPLKSKTWLSKLSKAAVHQFVFAKCETYKKKSFYMVFEYNDDCKISYYFVNDDLTNYGKYHKKYPMVYRKEKNELHLLIFLLWCYSWTGLVTYDMEKMNCKAFADFMNYAYHNQTFKWQHQKYDTINWKGRLTYGDKYHDTKKKAFAKGFDDGIILYRRTKQMINIAKKICPLFGIDLSEVGDLLNISSSSTDDYKDDDSDDY